MLLSLEARVDPDERFLMIQALHAAVCVCFIFFKDDSERTPGPLGFFHCEVPIPYGITKRGLVLRSGRHGSALVLTFSCSKPLHIHN